MALSCSELAYRAILIIFFFFFCVFIRICLLACQWLSCGWKSMCNVFCLVWGARLCQTCCTCLAKNSPPRKSVPGHFFPENVGNKCPPRKVVPGHFFENFFFFLGKRAPKYQCTKTCMW